jgi:ABC-type sulfate transport system permease component
MKEAAARPLQWLAALLAVYLCAPFVASIPQLGLADWHGVDWATTLSAVAVSAGSASVASLIILLGGVPLGYLLARSRSRKSALLGFVVQLPLALPPLTSGVLLLFLLGPYSWVGQLTNGALTDSFAGIVLAETFVAAPFLIIAARSAFASIDPMYEDVAATLGHRAGSRGTCMASRVRRIRGDRDGGLSPVFPAGLYLRSVRRPGLAGHDAALVAHASDRRDLCSALAL